MPGSSVEEEDVEASTATQSYPSQFVNTLGWSTLPAGGWLGSYQRFAKPQTDAPAVYHLAVGLAVVSAALGNSCWIEAFGQQIFPATWSLLLGPSSTVRKSSSIRFGIRVLNTLEGQDAASGVTAARGIEIPEPKSKEAFEDMLASRSDGLMTLAEFPEFLSSVSREHMAGLKEMLTRCYDGDSFAVTSRRDGTRIIKNPAVTVLAASTPEWLETRANEADVRGGFLARFMWWPATEADKGPSVSPFSATNWTPQRRTLANTLNNVRQYRGEFQISSAAQVIFENWLNVHESEPYVPSRLSGAYGRLPINVLKLSMALEASSGNSRSLVISADAMTAAVELATYLKSRARELFTETLVFDADGHRQRQVLEIIGPNGSKVSQREIYRRTRWKVSVLKEVLDSLIEQGRITRSYTKPEGGGPQTVWYANAD